MRTAFVTGATGFIGRHLVDALLDRGVEVRCLVRSPARAAHLNHRDGVRTVRSVEPAGRTPEGVMVLVSGFDRFVSYAYAGGTNLRPVQ